VTFKEFFSAASLKLDTNTLIFELDLSCNGNKSLLGVVPGSPDSGKHEPDPTNQISRTPRSRRLPNWELSSNRILGVLTGIFGEHWQPTAGALRSLWYRNGNLN
jgi:hypothetical protein